MLFTHMHKAPMETLGVGGVWGIAGGRGFCMLMTGKGGKVREKRKTYMRRAEAKKLWLGGQDYLWARF